jgi:hypothetical protein
MFVMLSIFVKFVERSHVGAFDAAPPLTYCLLFPLKSFESSRTGPIIGIVGACMPARYSTRDDATGDEI